MAPERLLTSFVPSLEATHGNSAVLDFFPKHSVFRCSRKGPATKADRVAGEV